MGDALTHPIVAPSFTTDVASCVDAEFVSCLVCSCSSVITGVKPAELFGFSPRGRRFNVSAERLSALAREATTVYAQGLADAPVHLALLGEQRGRQMLLCWRPEALAALLDDDAARAFLRRYELDVSAPEALAHSAASRLRAFYASGRSSGAFPHEVGILLGFPVEDVEGFIAHAGRGELACGKWKVYGDVVLAQRSFARMARAKKRCALLSERGYSVRGLIRDRAATLR